MPEPQEYEGTLHENKPEFSLFRIATKSRAFVLLFALLIQILFSGFDFEGGIFPFLMRGAIILAAIFMTADQKSHLIVGLSLGVPALILVAISDNSENGPLDWITYFFNLCLYLFIIRLMLKQIFQARVITLNTIGLALCTYILIGTVWVLFYTPVAVMDPNAFTQPMFGDDNNLHTIIYFSYVTLTTLGYGDISPVSNLARNLAILEAMTGTLFLAVLISRLVGSYVSRNKE